LARIAVIDYRMGNLASLKNSFAKIGAPVTVETDAEKLLTYDKLILPGVGAFGDASEHLHENGMDEVIREFVASGKHLLGVCLGMQMLFDSSEESPGAKGLGLVPGRVVRFDREKAAYPIKIPQMGWNRIHTKPHPLFRGLPDSFYLYFVHGYHAVVDNPIHQIGEADYGYTFTAAVSNGNVFGLQPHPEKSHDQGLQILKNFVEM